MASRAKGRVAEKAPSKGGRESSAKRQTQAEEKFGDWVTVESKDDWIRVRAADGAVEGWILAADVRQTVRSMGTLDATELADRQTAPQVRARPAALADLQRHGYSEEEISALVVPKRTLARRRAADELLTVEETDKALRLQRVAAMAERVFGEPAKAYRWMRKPKRALNGETPLAFLASEAGARVVEGMLHRIEHGMYA